MSLINVINHINRLSFANKVVVYLYLRNHLRLDEVQAELYQNASDPAFFTGLLNRKKELAIIEMYKTVPYLHVNNLNAKMAMLKILPVLLSYSTLYEMAVSYTSQILDMLKVHPAFVTNIHIFAQWFFVFEKRRLTRTRVFSYKDEFYFQNLPSVDLVPGDIFALSVGYADIALLRAFHRWLRLHRLHKYLFVFANLTYEQIITMDDSNIDERVESLGMASMTIGAKNKILRELDELRRRPNALMNNVIYRDYQSASDIEDAIRVIKKTLRTPIKVNDEFNEHLPQILVQSLKKVCAVILSDVVPFDERIIPLYGLLISVLKEAWNYTIFSIPEKDCFNELRLSLSEKIHNNYITATTTSVSQLLWESHFQPLSQQSAAVSTICLADFPENLCISSADY